MERPIARQLLQDLQTEPALADMDARPTLLSPDYGS